MSAHLTGSFKIASCRKCQELLHRLVQEGVHVRLPTTPDHVDAVMRSFYVWKKCRHCTPPVMQEAGLDGVSQVEAIRRFLRRRARS